MSLQIDPEDRIGGPISSKRPWLAKTIIVLIALIGGLVIATAYWKPYLITSILQPEHYVKATEYKPIFSFLEVDAPDDTGELPDKVRQAMKALARENCDNTAMSRFIDHVTKRGFRRLAADSLVTYSRKCGMNERALSRAYKLYTGINDHTQMINTAGNLIAHKPFSFNYYYWRGLGHVMANKHVEALDDLISAVELHPNKIKLRSKVFFAQSKVHEKMGRHCEAMTPILTWISLDPANRDNDQTNGLIKRYASQGNCERNYAAGTARIPFPGKNAIVVKAQLNGNDGTFIIDTGATFVTVSEEFAKRAGISATPGSRVTLQTANGIVQGRSTVIDQVAVQDAAATNVTAVVMPGRKNSLGKKLDGLLGLSFLARFAITIDDNVLTLSSRTNR